MKGSWNGLEWDHETDEIAERVELDEVNNDDLIKRIQGKKEVKVEEGTRALLLHDGRLVSTLDPGRHTLDSHWQKIKEARRGKDLTIILVDKASKTAEFEYEGLRSESDFEFSAVTDFDIRVKNLETFYTSFMQRRSGIKVTDIESELRDAIKNILESTLNEYSYDDLYGNQEVLKKIRREVKNRSRYIFDEYGLELVRLRFFDYEDNLEEVREKKREQKKQLMEEETVVEAEEEREGLRERMSDVKKSKVERETEEDIKEIEEEERLKEKAEKAERNIKQEAQETKQKLEESEVEHEEDIKDTKKERKIGRRDTEWEQDKKEMSDLVDVKKEMDEAKLDRKEREEEIEGKKIENRDEADIETLASLESTDESLEELAKMKKAENLSAEQLEALGAEENDELAKARQKAHQSESDEKRLEERKEMQDEMKDVMESAMEKMSETAQKASEDTSDNVIVDGSSDSGDNTTIVNDSGNDEKSEKEE
ncbi:MAG: SPFH domain-containing protein [Candidatus Nanohalobium sp.]